jgi:hypothetical protein
MLYCRLPAEHEEHEIKACYIGDYLQNTKNTGLRAVIVANTYKTTKHVIRSCYDGDCLLKCKNTKSGPVRGLYVSVWQCKHSFVRSMR